MPQRMFNISVKMFKKKGAHIGPPILGPPHWAPHIGPPILGPPYWAPHIGPPILGPEQNRKMIENRSNFDENWWESVHIWWNPVKTHRRLSVSIPGSAEICDFLSFQAIFLKNSKISWNVFFWKFTEIEKLAETHRESLRLAWKKHQMNRRSVEQILRFSEVENSRFSKSKNEKN